MGEEGKVQGEVATPEAVTEQTPTATLTREEHEKELATYKTESGRLRAELKKVTSIADSAVKRLEEIEEKDYNRRLEYAKDNPEELERIRKEKEDIVKQAEKAEEDAKLNTQFQKVMQTSAKNFATQYNVSEEVLMQFAGDDMEKMETLAKSFGERQSEGTTEARRVTDPPEPNQSKVQGRTLTGKDLSKMSPQELSERNAEIAKISFADLL